MRQEYGLMKRKSSKGKTTYYYWVYNDNDIRIYRSTGCRTKAEALAFVLKKREEGTLLATKRADVTLEEYAKPFFIRETCPITINAEKRGKTLAGGTLQNRRISLETKVLPYLGHYKIAKITPNIVNNWLLDLPEKTGCSRSSANNYLSALNLVLQQAAKDNIIRDNPCEKIELLKNDSVRFDSFTIKEVRQILATDDSDWKNPRVKTACKLAALTGMRIGEVIALQTENVSKDVIKIESSYSPTDGMKSTKNGKSRYAPITEELYNELMKLAEPGGFVFWARSHKPMAVNTINSSMNPVLDKLGIKGKSFHSFRAFFNTQLELSNINETVIRSVVGHQSAEMSEHYLHLESGDLSLIRDVQKQILA